MNIATIIKDIEGIPADILHIFESPAAEAALKEAATLAIAAAPYITEVDGIVAPFLGPAGELTLEAVNAAYNKYAVPLATEALTTPTQFGNALLNLVTGLLQKNHAPTVATSLLNTVVQLAVTAADTTTPAPVAA